MKNNNTTFYRFYFNARKKYLELKKVSKIMNPPSWWKLFFRLSGPCTR